MPETRVFVTVTSAILGDSDLRSAALEQLTSTSRRTVRHIGVKLRSAVKEEADSQEALFATLTDDGRTLGEVVGSVISRRLRKLEGLRAYLRSYMPGRRLLATGTGVVYADTGDKASDTFASPITKLSQQQTYLKGTLLPDVTRTPRLPLPQSSLGPDDDPLSGINATDLDLKLPFVVNAHHVCMCVLCSVHQCGDTTGSCHRHHWA